MSVIYELRDRVALVTINRPQKMNALNREVRERFREIFWQIDRDDDVKVVVITGAGEKAFSAGADLNEAGQRTAFERRRDAPWDPANIVRRCEKPVIAMIRGYCLGGGLELAAACDIRIASETAVFGLPEIRHGWLPAGGGGTQLIPRLVGLSRAMIMTLTGERLDAQKAKEIRLVDEVVPDDRLEQETFALANQIAQHRLRALILAKQALRLTERVPVDVGLEYERELSTITYYFEDRLEAIRAFQEKRTAKLSD